MGGVVVAEEAEEHVRVVRYRSISATWFSTRQE